MALTLDSFLVRFPQFAEAAQKPEVQAQIELTIASTALQLNETIWLDHYDDGHAYLTAHRLATQQGGQFARLASKDGSSTFGVEYERMRAQLLVGERVI